ncbi:Spo0B domain-containing protein [Paenibacillus eucommiae]|uniref:SpoOB alpha-helical domain-containing protein n=1 Tax=Paenibacillus eucommiae TaxID=1355755 RepID=A0ABS4JAB7_9BACL|nr:Spo0B domain-containing protein [Paenibacillus eucommiae]MBP1996787.1 hypothetical protein [Paenibacillus eucommiae]
MKRTKWVRIYLIGLLLIGLSITVLSAAWPVRAGFAIITMVSGYVFVRIEISRYVEEARQEKLKLERNNDNHILQIVNRLRHDWMNDIQVLFGYIQLKKYDNLSPYMEKIRVSMQQESFLTKLGIPSLVAYILTFRVYAKAIRLEIALEHEIFLQELPVQADLIFRLVRDTVELFNEHAAEEPDEAGILSLEFDVGKDHLLLDFVYQGTYCQEELELAVRDRFFRDSGEFTVNMHDFQEKEAVIALRLPYRT